MAGSASQLLACGTVLRAGRRCWSRLTVVRDPVVAALVRGQPGRWSAAWPCWLVCRWRCGWCAASSSRCCRCSARWPAPSPAIATAISPSACAGRSATNSAIWWMRTTSSATCCASSAWAWCSANCCSTRWCRTRRWRCCWSPNPGPSSTPTSPRGSCSTRAASWRDITSRRSSARRAAPLRDALDRGGDGLFSVGSEDEEEIYHLARRSFRLNGRAHELLLLRQITVELRRQEVQTWKKVIRVISHELNNSLAPVASLAHSGGELVRRGQFEKLPSIFATIEERARHLEGFIRGYAHFAKLPMPRNEAIRWPEFVARLHSQIPFAVDGALPAEPAHFDIAQMEQALLNLLKNAHESGSPCRRGEPARAPARRPVANRGDGPRQRHERRGPVQRAGAVLFDQAQRHRAGPGAGARNRRGARRPHQPGQSRGRRPCRWRWCCRSSCLAVRRASFAWAS